MKNLFQFVSPDFKDSSSSRNPTSLHSNDESQQELIRYQNKTLFLFHFSSFFLYLVQTFFMNVPVIRIMMGLLNCLLALTLSHFYSQYKTNTMKIIHNIVIAAFGPTVMTIFDEGIHRAWIGAHLYPTFILFCTGSKLHFLFQTCLQMTYVHTIYQSKLLDIMNTIPPEDLVKSMAQASTSLNLINTIMILCFYTNLQNAHQRIITAEKKKAETENQKTFLLSFSHELRNLMNSLIGNVRLASFEKMTQKAQNHLKNADICGELLLHLINNILDTGKVEVGELEVNPCRSDIYHTVEKIWNICSELIKGKSLQGKLVIHKNVPKFLRVDSYRLTQILLNLIGNAVKFTDKGSINITIEWMSNMSEVNAKCFEPYPYDDDDNEFNENIFEKNQRFSVIDQNLLVFTLFNSERQNLVFHAGGLDENQGLLKITVCDTGNGMSKEDIAKLFQKFTQVSTDASRRKIGTGLGLFITKQLCDKMKGQIKVFSKKDKGSCFIVCIPLNPLPIGLK